MDHIAGQTWTAFEDNANHGELVSMAQHCLLGSDAAACQCSMRQKSKFVLDALETWRANMSELADKVTGALPRLHFLVDDIKL